MALDSNSSRLLPSLESVSDRTQIAHQESLEDSSNALYFKEIISSLGHLSKTKEGTTSHFNSIDTPRFGPLSTKDDGGVIEGDNADDGKLGGNFLPRLDYPNAVLNELKGLSADQIREKLRDGLEQLEGQIPEVSLESIQQALSNEQLNPRDLLVRIYQWLENDRRMDSLQNIGDKYNIATEVSDWSQNLDSLVNHSRFYAGSKGELAAKGLAFDLPMRPVDSGASTPIGVKGNESLTMELSGSIIGSVNFTKDGAKIDGLNSVANVSPLNITDGLALEEDQKSLSSVMGVKSGKAVLFEHWIQGQLRGRGEPSSAQLMNSIIGGLQNRNALDSTHSTTDDSLMKSSSTSIDGQNLAATQQGIASVGGGTLSQTVENGSRPISAPLALYAKQWQGDFSQKINWMLQAGLEQAEIELDPADLGPISIHVKQTNGEIQVMVHAQHGQTRELFEQNQDRLREMLHQQGIHLSQFDVQSQAHGERQETEQSRQMEPNEKQSSIADAITIEQNVETTIIHQHGLLDFFV
jgi:hypothetical protein